MNFFIWAITLDKEYKGGNREMKTFPLGDKGYIVCTSLRLGGSWAFSKPPTIGEWGG